MRNAWNLENCSYRWMNKLCIRSDSTQDRHRVKSRLWQIPSLIHPRTVAVVRVSTPWHCSPLIRRQSNQSIFHNMEISSFQNFGGCSFAGVTKPLESGISRRPRNCKSYIVLSYCVIGVCGKSHWWKLHSLRYKVSSVQRMDSQLSEKLFHRKLNNKVSSPHRWYAVPNRSLWNKVWMVYSWLPPKVL